MVEMVVTLFVVAKTVCRYIGDLKWTPPKVF
jgi:hypothetical protein